MFHRVTAVISRVREPVPCLYMFEMDTLLHLLYDYSCNGIKEVGTMLTIKAAVSLMNGEKG